MKAWLLAIWIGCAPSPARPTHVRTRERPWLKLIEPDNEWTLPIAVTSGHVDAKDGYVHDQHETAQVHCAIKALEHLGTAVVSHLACDKPYDDLSISGTWVAQAQGLYHPLGPITQADDLATLLDDDLLINDPPRERDHSHSMATSTRSVFAIHERQGWCVTDKTEENDLEAHRSGERRSFTLCMDARHGIVSASELHTTKDGTWRSVQLGTDPPIDLPDPMHPGEGD